jgi:hypothetical protein
MHGALSGVGAALRAPLWIRDGRWRSLLVPADGVPAADDPGVATAHAPAAPPPHDPAAALRAARLTLRILGRVPGTPWRNTCLFRSVAECLVLRGSGVDARLRIGVGTEGAEVIAHAWVVRGGQPDADADPAAASLRPLAARA